MRLERESQKQSSDTNKTPYDRVKLCRERKNIKGSERVNLMEDRKTKGDCKTYVFAILNLVTLHADVTVQAINFTSLLFLCGTRNITDGGSLFRHVGVVVSGSSGYCDSSSHNTCHTLMSLRYGNCLRVPDDSQYVILYRMCWHCLRVRAHIATAERSVCDLHENSGGSCNKGPIFLNTLRSARVCWRLRQIRSESLISTSSTTPVLLVSALELTVVLLVHTTPDTILYPTVFVIGRERGGAVVTHWTRIREDPGSIPGPSWYQPAMISEITPGEYWDGVPNIRPWPIHSHSLRNRSSMRNLHVILQRRPLPATHRPLRDLPRSTYRKGRTEEGGVRFADVDCQRQGLRVSSWLLPREILAQRRGATCECAGAFTPSRHHRALDITEMKLPLITPTPNSAWMGRRIPNNNFTKGDPPAEQQLSPHVREHQRKLFRRHLIPDYPKSLRDYLQGRFVCWWRGFHLAARNEYIRNPRQRGRGGVVVRLLASHLGKPRSIPGEVAPGYSRVGIMVGDAAGRRVSSGISRLPPPPPLPRPCILAPRFTLIGSQDLDVKSRPNLYLRSSILASHSPAKAKLFDVHSSKLDVRPSSRA
ncbi:hypothetical protein PR048_025939 [Dryococelus australis]|uniref:Uncharacterized protein n=1 Tax=Dryococelus australis TaxID=614101 RepID=A0ABQ9GJZ0_9NEOP|nr:hypothetical protein PR048_025939 [Dryococelus australis]